jgi:hypothetical protein
LQQYFKLGVLPVNVKKWKLALIGIIIVSLVVAGWLARARYGLERQHRSVALAVVYDEVASLARMNGASTVDVLSRFRERGVGAVLVKEPTLKDAELGGEFSVFTGRELLLGNPQMPREFYDNLRGQVQPGFLYLVTPAENSYRRAEGQLRAKGVRVRTWEQPGLYIIEAGYNNQKLYEQIGLGIPDEAVEDIRAAGLKTLVQLRSWDQVTPGGLEYVLGQVGRIPNLAGVAFNDPKLPGAPDRIRSLAYELDKLDVPVIQIEFSPQEGFSRLGLLLDKHIVRLHTISLEEDAKKDYGISAMVDRFTLAATERNIRVLLLHSYMKTEVPGALQMNLQLAGELSTRLSAEGMQVGDASVLQPLTVSRGLLFVTGLGVIAGGMLLTLAMGWNRATPYLGLTGLLLWTGLLAVDPVSARKLMAFAAVVIFPTLSLVVNVKRRGSPVGGSILLLLRTSLYTFAGALLMVGLLADAGFMLKLDQFTGVKLAHVAPLLLVALIFFFRGDEDGRGWQWQLQRFLDQPIAVKFAVVGAILLVALLVYVSRTGNESAAISPLELKFRTLLDNLLGVRPRTKEFLLGHPLLLLLFYLGYRNNNYMPLLLIGAIGQVSLVNTYAHIHTPLLVSLTRSFHGLWLGIAGGLVLIALWNIGERLVQRYYYQ